MMDSCIFFKIILRIVLYVIISKNHKERKNNICDCSRILCNVASGQSCSCDRSKQWHWSSHSSSARQVRLVQKSHSKLKSFLTKRKELLLELKALTKALYVMFYGWFVFLLISIFRLGASVSLTGRNLENLQATASKWESFRFFRWWSIARCEGTSPLIIQGDVAKEDDCCRYPCDNISVIHQIHASMVYSEKTKHCPGLWPRLLRNLAGWMCW